MQHSKVLIVSATRLGPAEFVEHTLLGRSLRRLCFDDRLEMRPVFNNRAGLPAVYNRQICAENFDKVLLFAHDDLWLDDCFVCERLQEALEAFDVVGVAGCLARSAGQVSWDTGEGPGLSGSMGRDVIGGEIAFFGPAGQSCVLLEGAFLAVRCRTLLEHALRFDERFTFHHHDLDFCRSAATKQLRIGTWPISVTHAGGGDRSSPAWRAGLQTYLGKWGE